MRSTILLTSFAGLAGLSLLGACGDDGGSKPIDAGSIDARPIDGAVDAPPPIDAAVFKGYGADEGGEVRVEYIKYANGNTSSRGFAFVYKDPGTIKYHDYINTSGCTDVTARPQPLWPMSFNADRQYYDVGGQILLVSDSGANPTITLPKRAAPDPWTDPLAREHPANKAYFDPSTSADMDVANYAPASYYDVVFPGSAEFPGQVIDKGVYIPASFPDNTMTPAFNTTAIPLPAGQDITFTFDLQTETPPAGAEVFSLVAFTSAATGPKVLCVEKADGSVTVPAAFVDIVRAAFPSGAGLARQTFVHQVRELVDDNGPTGRRLDLVGVWCYAGQGFSVP